MQRFIAQHEPEERDEPQVAGRAPAHRGRQTASRIAAAKSERSSAARGADLVEDRPRSPPRTAAT
jgi:hypothetical protein